MPKMKGIAYNKRFLAIQTQNLAVFRKSSQIYALFYASPGIPGEKLKIPENPRPRGKLKTGEISHPKTDPPFKKNFR